MIVLLNATMLLYKLQLTTVEQCGEQNLCHALMHYFRYFLGLGRYAPNAAVNGNMGWSAPEHKQWVCVTRRWCRLAKLDSSLLVNKVFLYCVEQASVRCKNWCYRITVFFAKIEHDQLSGSTTFKQC